MTPWRSTAPNDKDASPDTFCRAGGKLREAADALISVVEQIAPDAWASEPKPGTWSPGKGAEHVADGAALHQWMVRTTLRQRAGARPAVPRS